jgi:hypothetical protein
MKRLFPRKSFLLFLDLEGPPRANWATARLRGSAKLIRQMSRDNPQWGSPLIDGELLKLSIGIAVAGRPSAEWDLR